MRRKTVGYITTSCLAARWMGATRVVIHTGALLKRTRRQALDIAKETLRQAMAACDDQGFGDINLCPEVPTPSTCPNWRSTVAKRSLPT